jgi:ABC-type transporter Mla MlaB component
VKINKTRDWLERTFWTFIAAFLALVTAQSFTNIDLSLVHKLESAGLAALFTTLKTVAAQRANANDSGAAIPGGIEK